MCGYDPFQELDNRLEREQQQYEAECHGYDCYEDYLDALKSDKADSYKDRYI